MTLFGLNQFIFLLLCRNILNVGYGHSMAKQTTKLRRKMTVAQILRNIFSCSLISFYLLPICFCVAVLSLPHLWNALAGEMNSGGAGSALFLAPILGNRVCLVCEHFIKLYTYNTCSFLHYIFCLTKKLF